MIVFMMIEVTSLPRQYDFDSFFFSQFLITAAEIPNLILLDSSNYMT